MNKLMRLILMSTVQSLIVACSSVAQEVQQYSTTDELLGFTPWQELELRPATWVSMIELIANGEKYDNQYIRTQGFWRYETEDGAVTENLLYVSRESFDYRIFKNAIDIGEILPECYGPLELMHGELIYLTGVYRHSRRMVSPIDSFRLQRFNKETKEREVDEILCKDPSIVFSQVPEME